MRIALLNVSSSGADAGSPWTTCHTSLAAVNMVDSSAVATIWDFSFTAGNPGYNGFSGGTGYLGGVVGSGSAAWVNRQTALSTGVGVNKSVGWYSTKFQQLDTAKQYKIDLFGSIDASGRILEARVNGGTSQTLTCTNNVSSTLVFDNISPSGSGEILLELKAADASAGFAYINAIRITELDSVTQDFTVNETTIRPGGTISGVYAGWPSAPTGSVKITDAAGNFITLTATVIGGAGSGTWSATLPSLPAAGNDIAYLKFGATTISFSAFTAKAGPSFAVATTQTLATLATGFDNYVFQEWTPQPAAGDQLVTNTTEGLFNSNGDYTFYAEGAYAVWYINASGRAFGLTINTSGLNDPVYNSLALDWYFATPLGKFDNKGLVSSKGKTTIKGEPV